MRSSLVFAAPALALVLSIGQQSVAAKANSAARELSRERQAKKACLSGEYSKGVSILADLFVETEDPVYLYNQGRCYEQNVRYIEAAERFREYLRKAGDLGADVKADVNKHIADCEAATAKSQSHATTDVAPPPAQQPILVPPPSYQPPPASNAPAPNVGAQATPGLATSATVEHPWQHTAKWIATGAAVAFAGVGVVEHLRYYTKNKDYNDDPQCGIAGQCKALADAADTARLVAIVGYGAAAAATGLAITFWLTDSPRPASGLAFSCSPMLGGASCSGRF
jgi:hypothetical protein